MQLGAKAHCIKTLLIPKMRYGLDVITCTTRAERDALHSLDSIIVKAMTHAVAGRRNKHAQLQARVKASVLHALLDIPSMSTEQDAAQLRFASKSLPHITAGVAAADPDLTSATHDLRAALPDEHPWRARVLSLAHATGVDLSARVDNDVVRDALWARDRAAAHALLCPTRRTSVRTRTTDTAGGSPRVHRA